ncbi:hypothetical protein pb186bvf_010008 [Paramecium bursaria]
MKSSLLTQKVVQQHQKIQKNNRQSELYKKRATSLKIFIVLPVHLYKNIDILKDYEKIIIFEDPFYFTQYNFHKLKLVYHRATMKNYYNYLFEELGEKIIYVSYNQDILDELSRASELGIYDPIDKPVLKAFNKIADTKDVKITVYENKSFLCTRKQLQEFHDENVIKQNGKKHYAHDQSFYRWQRRRLNILMPKNGKDPSPWTYDDQNRQNLEENQYVPLPPKKIKHDCYEEAVDYINKEFPKNFGNLEETIYPIDHKSSEEWLQQFLEHKLTKFGPQQDAVHSDHPFMFHSILSPMMNIGLLTSDYIIEQTLQYEKKHKVHLPSFEGFIRQVIGWREYVRLLYVYEGEMQMNSNFFNSTNKLSEAWYLGTTQIPPIDHMVKKVIKYAYLHHIERLMYLGNFMLLAQIDPKEVFRWFMEVHIDSYEWVMAPNVYGMTQFADGGTMMSRPYLCSSNYFKNMSNFGKIKQTIKIQKEIFDWKEVFDSLYYNFIYEKKDVLIKFYTSARAVGHWDKKTQQQQNQLIHVGSQYLKAFLIKK